jgi:hypothetical protein
MLHCYLREAVSDATRAHTSLCALAPFFCEFACLFKFACLPTCGNDTPPAGGVVTRVQFSPPHRKPSTQPSSFSVFSFAMLMFDD